MNAHFRWLAIAALIAVAGCATNGDEAPAKNGDEKEAASAPLKVRNVMDMVVRWAIQPGSGAEDRFTKLAPQLHGERIYVASRDGRLGSYELKDGNPVWTEELDVPLTGGPAIGGGLLLVGTKNAEVIALESETGKLLWRTSVSSEVLAPPKIADGMVVVQTNDGKLFGLRGRDGERVWVYDRAVPVLSLRGTSAPTIAGNTVIAGLASGRLVALNLRDGSLIWDKSIAVPRGRSELERMVDIDSEPQVVDGTVYAVTYQGRVAAVDLETGRVLWTRDMSSYLGLSVQDDRLYITDVSGSIWCLDRDSGATVWTQNKLKGRSSTAPAASARFIVVGGLDGSLYWLAPDDGRILAMLPYDKAEDQVSGSWREGWFEEDDFIENLYATEPVVISPPIIAGDTVYARYQNGVLAAIEVEDGRSR